MFTAALLTIGKIWKEPKCLLVDAWIKNVYSMEYLFSHQNQIVICDNLGALENINIYEIN
jgi:hypothetical protein